MKGARIYHDDSQVTHITAHKRRAARDEPTGAHITIAPPTSGASII